MCETGNVNTCKLDTHHYATLHATYELKQYFFHSLSKYP